MKRAICNKQENYYGFSDGKNYQYYFTHLDNYYVINKYSSRCAFNKENFDKYFIDCKTLRKNKLEKLTKKSV